jgi:hypothetical protein
VVDEIVKVLAERPGAYDTEQVNDGCGDPQADAEEAVVHGDVVAEKAAEEMRTIATTAQREAALDAKACLLLELCYQAFVTRVTQRQGQNDLAQTSVVRKKAEPGGVFALEHHSAYRFPRNGQCAFTYELRHPDLAGEVHGWVQVEVPNYSKGDPILVARWQSTYPRTAAERVLQESASALGRPEPMEQVQALAERFRAGHDAVVATGAGKGRRGLLRERVNCRVAQRDLWIRFNIMHLIGH